MSVYWSCVCVFVCKMGVWEVGEDFMFLRVVFVSCERRGQCKGGGLRNVADIKEL